MHAKGGNRKKAAAHDQRNIARHGKQGKYGHAGGQHPQEYGLVPDENSVPSQMSVGTSSTLYRRESSQWP